MSIEKERYFSRYWNNQLSISELRTLIIQLCVDDELYHWFRTKVKERGDDQRPESV